MAGVATEVHTALMRFQDSSPYVNWAEDNPGEHSRLVAYSNGATMPILEGIETEFGLALLAVINAGKYGDGTYPE